MSNHYQKYIKPRLESDPEFKAKHQACQNRRRSIRLQEDAEFRKKRNELARKHHARKYEEDPEYRDRKKAAALERYYRLKALKSGGAS